MKSLLLDGHTLLWALYEPEKLSPAAEVANADVRNALFVSDATLWELLNKAHRLPFVVSSIERMVERIEQLGVTFLPVTHADMVASALLPRHHGDPFDRMLVAQAQANDLLIVTIDGKIPLYDVRTLWK